jgi:hypothetical protein
MTDGNDKERALIDVAETGLIDGFEPLKGVAGIRCARVYHVGQGDSVAIIGLDGLPVFQVDYGGHQSNPFTKNNVDGLMPVEPERLVMLTHWDMDHWCSAKKGSQAKAARWLVPRQVTSPSAVKFATDLASAPGSAGASRISCIPEAKVGIPSFFKAGVEEIWWEKIGKSASDATKYEDCNQTGVAFSLVRRNGDGGGQVILLPGDAPFGSVGHYRTHFEAGLTLTGILAFHHGADTHWSDATRALLRHWLPTAVQVDVVFSCGDPNSYHHPEESNYLNIFGPRMRPRRTYLHQPYIDIAFV